MHICVVACILMYFSLKIKTNVEYVLGIILCYLITAKRVLYKFFILLLSATNSYFDDGFLMLPYGFEVTSLFMHIF